MTWPGVSDYQEAVQSPQLCFGDAALKAGSPVLTRLGLPRPISGGNASVYQIRTGKSEFAVRCFLRDVRDLRERYAAIGQHLGAVRLRSTVGFDYLQDGIRIRGRWHPVLKMEWVRGVPINEHVASICGDAAALRSLAEAWRVLMRELAGAKVAHGDLQHGNVLVAKGELVLIDYDGMFVPALAGRPGLELGHGSFQHPLRAATDFGPDIDRFAALAIHVALLALAERPQLWATYDNADNLLFTRDDFAAPASSPLFAELAQCKDPGLVAEVAALRAACGQPIAAVPTIEACSRPAAAAVAAPVTASNRTSAARSATATTLPAAVRTAGDDRRPQWLATLMATASTPAPIASSGGAAVAFSLAMSWRHAAASRSRPASATAATRPARERAAVLAVLAVLVQFGVYLFWGPAVLGSAALTTWLWWRSRVGGRNPVDSAQLHPTGAVLALSSDGRRLAVLAKTGNVDLLELASGRRLGQIAIAGQPVLGVIAIADGGIVTAAANGVLRFHGADGGERLARRHARARCLAASPDGRLLAFGSHQGRVGVLGSDGDERCTLQGHTDAVTAVAIAADGQRLVSGSADHAVRLWSLTKAACEQILVGHASAVTSAAISGNGRFVAAGAVDGSVAIWDGKRHKLLHTVRTGGGPVLALAFAPDQAQLLATCSDRAIHCLDAITGKALGRVAGHAAPAVAIAIAPGGAAVITADADGNVLAWHRRARSVAAPAAALVAAQP